MIYKNFNEYKENIFVCEGFTDLQVNGYKGLDYSSEKLTEEDVNKMVLYLAESGTVRHLPTIITGEKNKTLNNIRTIIKAGKNNSITKAAIPGIHLEGPFISPNDGTRGAHDIKYVRLPNIAELHKWHEESKGLVKIITLAPELENSCEFISEAVKLGIQVSIGHSDAGSEHIKTAVKAGMSLSTHLGNGIKQIIDRRINPIWEQLANDSLKAGIITDGFHLFPEQIITFYKAKTLSNIFLVSDVGPLGGMDTGIYKWGNIDVQVYEDGHLGLPNTTYLAGAGHLLDTCIAHFANISGLGVKEVLKTVIDTPNKIIGIPGSINKFDNDAQHETYTVFEYKPGMKKLKIIETCINSKKLY